MCLSVYTSCSVVPFHSVLSITVLTAQQITPVRCLDSVTVLIVLVVCSAGKLQTGVDEVWGGVTTQTSSLYLITAVWEWGETSVRGGDRGLNWIFPESRGVKNCPYRFNYSWSAKRLMFGLSQEDTFFHSRYCRKMTTNPVSKNLKILWVSKMLLISLLHLQLRHFSNAFTQSNLITVG